MVVPRVIDGDTIDVRGDGRIVPKGTVTRVRLLEIDTPERGACFADTTTARTSALLPPGSNARAERDVESTDRYDRHLLYVWNHQGVIVNESLVRSGHATAVLFPPNDKHWPAISAAVDRLHRTGPSATTSTSLWTCRAMPPPPPWAWWCRRPVVCARARSSCCCPARSTRWSVRRWSTARPAHDATAVGRRERPAPASLIAAFAPSGWWSWCVVGTVGLCT
ncbi:thermonuclease family protein [Streptomyces phaeochromogenes]